MAVSPDLISKVTDAVADELAAWQNRPLDAIWPIITIDALWDQDPGRACRTRSPGPGPGPRCRPV
ncbi:transposase [Streptomyces sp. NPDC004629]|uniref:transposase n=1 Tax=Streptomyces sp. NPDC004629 TaxID=3364705 RepID=UPI0036BC88A2